MTDAAGAAEAHDPIADELDQIALERPYTPDWLNDVLLEIPKQRSNLRAACRTVGKSYSGLQYHRDKQPDYAAAVERIFGAAHAELVQELEQNFYERLIDGDIEETVEKHPDGTTTVKVKKIKTAKSLLTALERLQPDRYQLREPDTLDGKDVTFKFVLGDRELHGEREPAAIDGEATEIPALPAAEGDQT